MLRGWAKTWSEPLISLKKLVDQLLVHFVVKVTVQWCKDTL